MRCFIAIDLPEDLKRLIGGFIEKFDASSIDSSSGDIRWVPPQNIHLTLKFLGEINEEMLVNIGRSLRVVCSIHKPFSITLEGTGVFPNYKNPNVLWIGVKKSEELKNLYVDIEQALAKLGFEKEGRKHTPHLTIGRVKSKKNITQLMKSFDGYRNEFFGTMPAKEVRIIKSILKPSGAEYSVVASFRLKSEIT